MVKSVWIEYGDNAHDEKAASCDTAKFEADHWQATGLFDWFVTFSFDERHRRRTPESVYRFVKQKLEHFGYFGPFVIVPHDNSKTSYYHAHCLLANYRAGLCESLTLEFQRYGNVQKADDGPIRGCGAFLYCANRAVNYHTKEAQYEERLRWQRRPRKRGRGSNSTRSRIAAVSA